MKRAHGLPTEIFAGAGEVVHPGIATRCAAICQDVLRRAHERICGNQPVHRSTWIGLPCDQRGGFIATNARMIGGRQQHIVNGGVVGDEVKPLALVGADHNVAS